MRSVPVGEVRRLGDRALLAGVEDADAARRLIDSLALLGLSNVREMVGGMATVMVELEAHGDDPDVFVPELAGRIAPTGQRPGSEGPAGTLHVVPCTFDGPDMDEVAERAGCSAADVVALMTAQPLTVAVVGFSPGFAYLDGLPQALQDVRRRRTPRPSVPAGSVALANGHAAVYPTASPGGWQLIGRTAESFFSPRLAPYARLSAGDRVQFTVAAGPVGSPSDGGAHTWSPPPGSRAVFEVEHPGLRTVLQDGGRRGVGGIGVPSAGPGDPYALTLANRLVGNPAEAAALEVTASGPTLHCLGPAMVAVVGGSPTVSVAGQPVTSGKVFPVNAGQQLTVGAVREGLRSYVAVAGGLLGDELFGSVATDQLCGLGPGPIAAGQSLWAAELRPPLGDHLLEGTAMTSAAGQPIALRVVPGPHAELFAGGSFEVLCAQTFTVAAESNRVGVRLVPRDGQVSALAAESGRSELDSQGTVTGVVQVPPDGHPVVLLPDHATLGGYPVLAVVASADHGLLGQCAPGSHVVLVPIEHGEARRALAERRRQVDSAVVGHYPLAVD
jgi:biotin-dependent carboxylase-like uncharacterized protein